MNNPILLSRKSDKSLMVFNNTNFGSIRTVELNGKIYFCGKDVAGALGYKETSKAIREHCKGVSKIDIPTKGGIQETSFIPEGDVYRLITSSKLPTAEKFESWVFDEVLPSIRKNGGYIENQENLTDEQLMAKALVVAQNVIAKKDAVIEEMKPKAEYFDSYCDASNLEEIGHLGKVTKIGEQKIFKVLVADGYIKVRYSTDDVKSYDPCFGYEKYFETIHVPFLRGDKQLSRDKLMLNHKGFMYFRSKYASKEELLETAENYIERAINNCPECNNTYIDKITSKKIKTYSYSEVAAEAGEDEQTIINFCKAKGWIDENNKPYSFPDFDYFYDNLLTEKGKDHILATFLKIKNAEKGMKKTSCGKGE